MILFVHGMGSNSDRNYWQAWAKMLQQTLAKLNVQVKDEHFGGVYYYDLVPGPHLGQAQPEAMQIQLLGLRKKAERELIATRASAGIKEMGVIRNFADYIVDNFGDVFSYLYWGKTYDKVNQRLYTAIDDSEEPVHLIGYSLGSLVSYCALMQNPALAPKVRHLLLLGSPLYWFKQGVAMHVDFDARPLVGRLTNIAGIADIAWPQMVPKIISTLDHQVSFIINPINPIKGHQDYFYREEGLSAIATEIAKAWE